jgi:GNAT superfamily N-acetyltransferase
MANFYMTLPADEIARQVAQLINDHNQLRKKHTAYTILASPATYFVDVVAGRVVACSAMIKETVEATRLFHLCVHPDYRGKGIARKLKEQVLKHVETPYVYVTIREDNVVSIHLNESMGFREVKREWVGDHNVLTLARLTTDGSAANPMAPQGTGWKTSNNISGDGLFINYANN